VQAFGARLLYGAEYIGAKLGAVRLLAACSCAFGHCARFIREYRRCGWLLVVCLGEVRRRPGGEKFEEIWWQGVSIEAGPCPSRVLRLVAGDADFGIYPAGDALAARAAANVDGHIVQRVALRSLLVRLLLHDCSARASVIRSASPPGFWELRPTPVRLLDPQISAFRCLYLTLRHQPKTLPERSSPRCLREKVSTGSASPPTSNIASPHDRDGSTRWRQACSRWLPP
jgi:hypothetical protein